MPSPDVTPYIDLTLNDKDAQDVYDNAVSLLQTNLPEWRPREGNTEVLLLEALAQQVSEGIFAINRLPSAVVEVLAQLFGIDRDAGAAPVANLQFTMINDTGNTIPAGTQVRLDLQNNDFIVFTTNVALDITAGNFSGTVAATGDTFTSVANGIDDTAVQLMDSLLYVSSVMVVDPITSGRDPEDDTAYFTRATQRFSRLNDTLVLPRHFEAATLEDPTFQRALALDDWDGTGPSVPGDDAGHITVAVYGPSRFNTTGEKNALLASLEESALGNLAVHVIDPTITPVDVTVSITVKSGFVQADVINAVEDALTEYLDPMTWEWGDTVYRNELIALIDGVEGVDRVVTLSVPASDLALTGEAPLADADTLSVSVV